MRAILRHSQGVLILETLQEAGSSIDIKCLIAELFRIFVREDDPDVQTSRVYQLIPFIDFILDVGVDGFVEMFLEKLVLFDLRAVEYCLDGFRRMGYKLDRVFGENV
jgi:hypothetical protein